MRIAGVTIPEKKRLKVALTSIYGIGYSSAAKILAEARILGEKKIDELSTKEANVLRDIIEKKYKIEGDLRREVGANIKRLRDIKSYRGSRHIKGLPVRGQRTRTNSRTRRGNVRRTMSSGKRKMEKK
jgi:small subunit ribosomal protein S13